jgi:hypothetical protein
LRLAARGGLIADPPIPAWDEIRPQLELHNYFIELSALSYLLEQAADAAHYLRRFQVQRRLPAGVGFPAWLHDGLLVDWDGLVRSRVEHEHSALCGGGPPDVARLLAAGLLPL